MAPISTCGRDAAKPMASPISKPKRRACRSSPRKRPGVPEVVRSGTTGLLTREGDVSQFAQAIRRLIPDPKSRRMAAAAREFVLGERSLEQASGAGLLERPAGRPARRMDDGHEPRIVAAAQRGTRALAPRRPHRETVAQGRRCHRT